MKQMSGRGKFFLAGTKLRKFGLDDPRFYFYDGRPDFGGGYGGPHHPYGGPEFYPPLPHPPPQMALPPGTFSLPTSMSAGVSGTD